MRRARATATLAVAVVIAVALLSGCSSTKAPPEVRVHAGSQTVSVKPTQYCLDGTVERYQVQPPIIQVEADMPITLTVPDAVAQRGWSVQVWDEKLATQIGDVAVDRGKAVVQIDSSDAVPAAYYFVVVERATSECRRVSGAWPVGFIRGAVPAPSGATQPSGSTAPSASPSAMP